MSTRRFELLKDLPNAKAKSIFQQDCFGSYGTVGCSTAYNAALVENNPTWFKEIKDTEESSKPFEWDDTDAFVATCKAADIVIKANGNRGIFTIGDINDFQDTLKSLGYSIYKIPQPTQESSKPFVFEFSELNRLAEATGEILGIRKILADYNKTHYDGKELSDVLSNAVDKISAVIKYITQQSKQQAANGKDWEIVDWKYKPVGNIVKEVYEPYKNLFEINSVKRLSDGEVFGVGDDYFFYLGSDLVSSRVERFEISTVNGMVMVHGHRGWSYLNDIEKPSKPQQQSKIVEVGDLPHAMGILVEHLRKDKSDGSHYYAWQANIAIAFQDCYREEFGDSPKMRPFIHDVANAAAKRFLDSLINIPKVEK